MLARDAQAALDVNGALVRALLRAGQRLLELDHARVGEEQRLVARGNERCTGHDLMTARGKEVDKVLAYL